MVPLVLTAPSRMATPLSALRSTHHVASQSTASVTSHSPTPATASRASSTAISSFPQLLLAAKARQCQSPSSSTRTSISPLPLVQTSVLPATPATELLSPAAAGGAPNTCQIFIRFTPTRPGLRSASVKLADSPSGKTILQGLQAVATGSLSAFTPGTVNTIVSTLAAPVAVTVDSNSNAYVLEAGNGSAAADLLLLPSGGVASQTVIPQGAGLLTPSAVAIDSTGNFFIADVPHGQSPVSEPMVPSIPVTSRVSTCQPQCPIGNYPIIATLTSAGTTTLANYTITNTPGI
jgi:hypothetical protein